MEDRQNETMGSLQISDEVIATIAGLAATEIEGVAGLSAGPMNIKTLINALTPAPSKSIHITMDDGVAVIDVFVSLKYGANIPEVAANIQSNIKNNVQNMTGIAVSKVNVHIADIDLSEAQGE